MYGDTEVMRRQAGRLGDQAEVLRALADRLVAQAESVPWTGRAADSMRERTREHAARLRVAAERHDAAAASMQAHIGAVEELKDAIDQVERRSRRLGEDGLSLGFEPPPSGHRDWLSVRLPSAGQLTQPAGSHDDRVSG